MSTSAAAAPTPSSSLSSSSAPVVVHFLSDSRAESILWLLEELGVDYRIHYWRREPNMLAPKGLRQIHPLGKSPVLEHAGQTIAETGNIIEYLLSRAFQSETTAAFRQYPTAEGKETDSYFMFYVEGSLMPILVNKLVFSKFPAMSPWYIRPIISSFASSVDKMWLDKQLVTHLAMIDDVLKKSPNGWVAGGSTPTGADFALFFPLNKLSTGRGGDVPCPESIKAWVERVKARPAFAAAFEKLAEAEKAYDAGLHTQGGEGASTTAKL